MNFIFAKSKLNNFLLLRGLTSNPRHDASVLLVEISIHGLQCSGITRPSKYIIHESRLYSISFSDSRSV